MISDPQKQNKETTLTIFTHIFLSRIMTFSFKSYILVFYYCRPLGLYQNIVHSLSIIHQSYQISNIFEIGYENNEEDNLNLRHV